VPYGILTISRVRLYVDARSHVPNKNRQPWIWIYFLKWIFRNRWESM